MPYLEYYCRNFLTEIYLKRLYGFGYFIHKDIKYFKNYLNNKKISIYIIYSRDIHTFSVMNYCVTKSLHVEEAAVF